MRISEVVKADEERIAGERREALIRRVAVARGSQREDLPDALPSVREERHKLTRRRTEVTNSETSRQRRRMKEHTTRSRMGGQGSPPLDRTLCRLAHAVLAVRGVRSSGRRGEGGGERGPHRPRKVHQ